MTDQTMEAAAADTPVKVPRKGLSGKKLVLFIILPLLLVGGGAGVYLTGAFGFFGKEKKAAEEAQGTPRQAIFYNLPDLLVNLNSNGRKTHFLKLSIAFELKNDGDAQTLQSVLPRIIDNFQVYLRELRVEDLQGAAGIQRLREELLVRVNSAIRPLAIKDVLFKEMLIQ